MIYRRVLTTILSSRLSRASNSQADRYRGVSNLAQNNMAETDGRWERQATLDLPQTLASSLLIQRQLPGAREHHRCWACCVWV